jgi:hypothetical protein
LCPFINPDSPGNGKAHLAAAAANILVARGRAVLFATAPELLAMIWDGFDAGQVYAYVGVGQDGLRIIDVSNPVSPTWTGSYAVSDYIYDVALMGDLAYLAADDAGLHIVGVSNPVSPTSVSLYAGMDQVQAVAVARSGPGNALAYICGEREENDSPSVLDVSDPASPVEVGYYDLLAEAISVAVAEVSPGQTHIYVASQEGGLVILQVKYYLFLPLVLRNSQ